MVAPDFFSDEELVGGMDIPGRLFYLGTWSVAEDSGVLTMSPLSLKMKIFPGDDISPEQLETYINRLVQMRKIVPFEYGGKQYGWIKNFNRHQKLDNPSPPTLPLPSWVNWIEGETRKKNKFEVDDSALQKHLLTLSPGHVPDKTGTSPAELKELKKGIEVVEVVNGQGQVPEQTMLPPLDDESQISLETYCQEIENQMIACGARHGYQASGEAYDWTRKFYNANVPIQFIRSGIVQAYDKNKDISTFTYCAKVIKDLWSREVAKQNPIDLLEMNMSFHKSDSVAPPVDEEYLKKFSFD